MCDCIVSSVRDIRAEGTRPFFDMRSSMSLSQIFAAEFLGAFIFDSIWTGILLDMCLAMSFSIVSSLESFGAFVFICVGARVLLGVARSRVLRLGWSRDLTLR